MRLSTTRLFPLVLMLALAGLTFWLERTVREEETLHPSLRRHDPDYIIDQLVHTRFNAQGAVESTLVAAKMIHYPDDDTTDLVAPRVVQTKPNEPRMTVTADRGALSQDGEEIFLYGNVLVVREGGPDRSETRMRTSVMHVVQAHSVLRTDRDVRDYGRRSAIVRPRHGVPQRLEGTVPARTGARAIRTQEKG